MNTPAQLFRGAATTSATDVYVASALTIVSCIKLTSLVGTQQTVTLKMDGVELLKDYPVDGKSLVVIDKIAEVLVATKKINVACSANGAVNVHISGVQVT